MEWLNNFYMTVFDFQMSNAVVIAGFTYGLLVVMLIIAALDLDVDIFVWVGLVQVVFNIIFCIGYLLEHYIGLTRLTVFIIPYFVVGLIVVYTIFISDRVNSGK